MSINNIVDAEAKSQRPQSDVGGKAGLVESVVELAVDGLWGGVARLLPEGETDPAVVRRGLSALFGALATGLRDEQTVVVMAWVELPSEGRECPHTKSRAGGCSPPGRGRTTTTSG